MAEPLVSSLRTQADVDALCEKHGVPSVYVARPAGDMLASSEPPPGSVWVYAHALEAGMRVPLHPFFSEALAHFGLARAQLSPEGWRVLVGFVVLCDFAGVARPSLAVFRSFFSLREAVEHGAGLYGFRSRDASLQARMPRCAKDDWKRGFFFLSSPEPWPCPVEWGEPSEGSVMQPVLNDEEKKWAAKLLRTHGGAAVGLKTYLCGVNPAAGALVAAASPPPPPRVVKTEQGSDARCRSSPMLSGRKRKFEEANGKESVSPSLPRTPPPSIPGCSLFGGAFPPPTGCSTQNRDGYPRQSLPDRHDGDSAHWEAARNVLECVVTPSREQAFAAAKPSDVIASGYVAMLQAANYASFSFGYALELEGKLAVRDEEIAALREQLENATAELAATKAKLEGHDARLAEHAAAEHVRRVRRRARLAEHAAEGHDATRLVAPAYGTPLHVRRVRK